jgi:hypothetical protein
MATKSPRFSVTGPGRYAGNVDADRQATFAIHSIAGVSDHVDQSSLILAAVGFDVTGLAAILLISLGSRGS